MTSYLFLADGFEEVEALATIDVLRRAGMTVNIASVNDDMQATGANGVTVAADMTVDSVSLDDCEWLIAPGGMPGASNLAGDARVTDLLTRHYKAGGKVAAICASPAVVLAPLGILDGRAATCYPGMESLCPQIEMTGRRVEADARVITANGPGSTFLFALAIVSNSKGEKAAQEVAAGMLVG